LLLPEGEDPDSFAKKLGKEKLLKYIQENETDFIKFKTSILLEDTKNDPIKRAQLIQDIVRTISVIPDPIVRAVYIKECSKLMNVEEPVLYTEIGKIKKNKRDKEALRSPVKPANNEQSPESTTTATPLPQITDNPFDTEEKEVLRFLIKYGEKMLNAPVTINGEDKSMTVGEFIVHSLKTDDVRSLNSLHNQIIEEYDAHFETPGFIANRYFVSHPNPAVSKLVTDLVASEYQLSRIHNKYGAVKKDEEMLDDLVPRVVTELKWKIVKVRMDQVRQKLKMAQEQGKHEELLELIQEMTVLQQAFKFISHQHGERTII